MRRMRRTRQDHLRPVRRVGLPRLPRLRPGGHRPHRRCGGTARTVTWTEGVVTRSPFVVKVKVSSPSCRTGRGGPPVLAAVALAALVALAVVYRLLA